MLRFAEEIMLLLLDDENGSFARVPDRLVRYALGGGVLMELALEDRIDTDLNKLILVDSTPLQDSLIDPMLSDIAAATETHDTRYWLERAAARADAIREGALRRLVQKGILASEEGRFLWVFRSRRYPAIDGKAELEVKLRIMEVLFSDKIPDPRDVVIICLADACGIFEQLLASRELARATGRIEQVRKLDLIGQEVTKAIWDIEASLALAVQPHMY